MSLTLSEESKNSNSLSLEAKADLLLTWATANETWDEAAFPYNSERNVISSETKIPTSLTYENKT